MEVIQNLFDIKVEKVPKVFDKLETEAISGLISITISNRLLNLIYLEACSESLIINLGELIK